MRPAIISPWASTPNTYPAGANPWSGQPILVAPNGDYFTPKTPIPAQVMNYLFNQRDAQDNAILTAMGAEECANWRSNWLTGLWGGIPQQAVACYDAFWDRWLVGSIAAGGGIEIAVSVSGGQAWNFTSEGSPNATTNQHAIAMCTRSTDGLIVVIQTDSGAGGLTAYSSANSGTWTSVTTGTRPTCFAAAALYSTAFSKFFVFGAQGTAPPATTGLGLWTATDGHTWSSHGSALPASFTTLASGNIGHTGSGGAFIAQSPTAVMVAIASQTAGKSAYAVTTNGTTWTDVSFGTGIPLSLTYDAANGYWVSTIYQGGNISVIIAQDATPGTIVWQSVRTFTGFDGGTCAADGGIWCVGFTTSPRITASSAGQEDCVYSQDLGATWNYGRYTLQKKTSAGAYMPTDTLVAGGGQFLAFNADSLAMSVCVGPAPTPA